MPVWWRFFGKFFNHRFLDNFSWIANISETLKTTALELIRKVRQSTGLHFHRETFSKTFLLCSFFSKDIFRASLWSYVASTFIDRNCTCSRVRVAHWDQYFCGPNSLLEKQLDRIVLNRVCIADIRCGWLK